MDINSKIGFVVCPKFWMPEVCEIVEATFKEDGTYPRTFVRNIILLTLWSELYITSHPR